MSATLTIRDDGDVTVIDAHGKLASGEGRHSLHERLRRLAESGHFRILLRVSGAPSMDAADIGELMAGYAAVTMAGGELKLLDTYVDEASAIRSFTGIQPPQVPIDAACETRSEWYFG